jgi:DNA helicase-2/ATP-dependent DNA helicase PcrA
MGSWEIATQKLFEKLDAEQREVAKWTPEQGNLQVSATAGSGKTTAVTALTAALLYTGAVAPDRLIITTFTNKAAAELRTRLRALLRPDLMATLRVGTFHSLAIKAMRSGSEWNMTRCLDASPRTRAKDLMWSGFLWRKIVKETKPLPYTGAKGLGLKKDERAYAMAMDNLRCEGISNREWLTTRAIRSRTKMRELAAAWEMYDNYKAASNSWDFADVLHAWWAKLAAGAEGESSADVIIVDEAQDNDCVQLDIARLLVGAPVSWAGYRALVRHAEVRQRLVKANAGGRIVLTGDGSQGIYSWRGAYSELFLHATKVMQATKLTLPNNYRSRPALVDVGNRVIQGRKWALGLQAKATRPAVPGALRVVEEFDDEATEASWVADQIKAQIDAGTNPNDFTILSRTNASLGAFQAELIARQIPLVMLGGKSLFRYREAQAVLGYLTLSSEELETVPNIWPALLQAVDNCCNRPLRYLGGRFVQQVRAEQGSDVPDVIRQASRKLSRGSGRNARELATLIEDLRRQSWQEATHTVEKLLVEWCESDPETGEGDPDEDRPGIYQVACSVARKFEGPIEFLAFVNRCQNGTLEMNIGGELPPGRVTLSTIHKFKGLESEHVFLPASEGQLPHWRNLPSNETPDKRRYDGVSLEEELRLFYVAITRARETLTLTASGQRRGPRKLSGVSRFTLRYVLDHEEDP